MNWSPAIVPGGNATLTNSSAADNRAIVDYVGTTTVCALTVGASGSGRQIVQIEDGAALNAESGTTIDEGGEIDLHGGMLTSPTIILSDSAAGAEGTLYGYGWVTGDVSNGGTMEAAVGGDLTIAGSNLINQLSGVLMAPFASLINVQSPSSTQLGTIEVRTAAAMYFEHGLVNASGGRVNLLGGAIGAPTIANNPGGEIVAYGSIEANVNNDGSINTLSDVDLFGDLVNNGSIIVQNGLFTIIGQLSGTGTITGDFSSNPEPATGDGLTVLGDYSPASQAAVTITGGTLKVSGHVDIAIDDGARFDLRQGALQLVGLATEVQTLEVLSPDRGDNVMIPSSELYSIDTLRVGPTTATVKLVDSYDNAAGSGNEVLYVHNLVLSPGATLDLAGLIIYYASVSPVDPFDPGDGVFVVDTVGGGDLIPIQCVFGDVSPERANGIVNLDDILCVLGGFADPLACPDADVLPCLPNGNGVIDLDDILGIISAFGGNAVCPFACP